MVSIEEREWGLSFVPPSQELQVLLSPVSSLSFSQFTATLSGSLTCIGQCVLYLPLYQSGPEHVVYMTQGSSFFFGKSECRGCAVLLCLIIASFLLPSSSLINMYSHLFPPFLPPLHHRCLSTSCSHDFDSHQVWRPAADHHCHAHLSPLRLLHLYLCTARHC